MEHWKTKRKSVVHLLQTVVYFVCEGENFIQLIFGHDLFYLQLINIDTFISVYFSHCSFLFCLWISTEAKRKLGIDEISEQLKWKMTEQSRIEARGVAGFCRVFKTNPWGYPGVDPQGSL